MTPRRMIAFLCLLLLWLGACAKEQSQEDVNREQRDRSVARTMKAAGDFNGFVKLAENKYVPFSLNVSTKILTNEPAAQPEVGLRIGLFGGVYFAADSTTYDSGSGLLIATVNNGQVAGNIPGQRNQLTSLEFRATVMNRKISGASLKAADVPDPYQIIISNQMQTSFDEDTQYVYTFGFGHKGSNLGELSLTRKLEYDKAPAGIDMPYIPALLGGLQFAGSAATVNAFTKVVYDPLKAVMDLYLSDVNRLSFSGVALRSKADAPVLPALTGVVMMGGAQVGTVFASLKTTHSVTSYAQQQTEMNYLGSARVAGQSDAAIASGILQYQYMDGTNPSDLIFPCFPKAVMHLLFCDKDVGPIMRSDLQLASVDYLHGIAQFVSAEASASDSMLAHFSPGFHSFDGVLRAARGGGGLSGMAGFSVSLRAANGKALGLCQ